MRITEHSIEDFAIKLLEDLGYEYIYAPNIGPDASTGSATGENPERNSHEEVLNNPKKNQVIMKIKNNQGSDK